MIMDSWQYENYMEDIERKMKKQITNKRVTNADRIRSMSDKGLAELLIKTETLEEVLYYAPDGDRFDCYESCLEHTLKWLNS